MADVVLFGAGQIAQVARVYLDAHGPDRVVGFTVDASFKTADRFDGLPLVAWERLEETFPPGAVKLLGPLSFRRLNELRRDRHLDGKRRGYEFATFIHPATLNYATSIGENSFILEHNVLQPFVRIGVGVMMWTANHIGHHAEVGDYCFLASHVALGGGARIGQRCFLAGKVGVESGVRVGDDCFLGSAVLVKRDLPPNSVVPSTADAVASYPSSRIKRFL